jgi:uncharacterized membrane protein SirB2
MSKLLLLLAATLLLVSGVASHEVVVLTQNNFEDLTATGPWLIEFYAPVIAVMMQLSLLDRSS